MIKTARVTAKARHARRAAMGFRSWCRLHLSGNVLGSSQPCVGGLASLTPTAPCVLHQFDEDVPRRTLPPRPGYRPRSGSSLRAHPCTVARPSPCGRDGGPADMDMTLATPFNVVIGHGIGWQESCPALHPHHAVDDASLEIDQP